MSVVGVNHLTKYYHRALFHQGCDSAAVNDISFSVHKGEIFAFLGPNGAGKTTTIKILVGLIRPTHGTVSVFGETLQHEVVRYKSRIGYVPETPFLPTYYRTDELLQLYGTLLRIRPSLRPGIIDTVLARMGIAELKKEPVKRLSMGQKRCLGLAIALLNNPELIILDEPTVYLDPLMLEKWREILLELKRAGKTIFLSSHTLSEVEKISDRFAIIKKGKLIQEGVTAELLKYSSLEKEFLNKIKEADSQQGAI